ncbi:cysteine-rich repeat secretory protein 55-like [Zingiber officinale]|uniref:Gnk2-homologous domain-containing protein n=1 Tax=Zingiber officinale TaxID=94328 RepID=A0A8J5F4E5_ZINOF|nr:cysteine-rich repeat secretory protein 55-like [Zingiber officinale]KAG6481511.1 hypothetical protein ZIOFF_058115 [Zingiber officinale]
MALIQLYHLILLCLFLPFSAYADNPIGYYCANPFNAGATQARINTVLSDIVAHASIGGFATSSSGRAPATTIYGLAQCRADVSSQDCSACLQDAAKALPAACPHLADARIWYDYCFLRYDDENFIGESDTGYSLILYNVENVTGDGDAFDAAVGEVMRKARAAAVAPGTGGLGRETTGFSPYVNIYGLAQCTRDIGELACGQCTASAVERFADFCVHRKGCRVLYSSCMVRYEIYPFFFPIDSKRSSSSGSNSIKSEDEVGSYSMVILSP